MEKRWEEGRGSREGISGRKEGGRREKGRREEGKKEEEGGRQKRREEGWNEDTKHRGHMEMERKTEAERDAQLKRHR